MSVSIFTVASAGFQAAPLPVPTCGALYRCDRSDLLLGHGQRSITWRALYGLARRAQHEDPAGFADTTAHRVAYAQAILAEPKNGRALARARGSQISNAHGLTLDVRARPVIMLPDAQIVAGGLRCG